MLNSLLVVETASSPAEPIILITAVYTLYIYFVGCCWLLRLAYPKVTLSWCKYIDIPRLCIALCEFQEENNKKKTRNIGNVCYKVGNKSHKASDDFFGGEMGENVSKELIKHQVWFRLMEEFVQYEIFCRTQIFIEGRDMNRSKIKILLFFKKVSSPCVLSLCTCPGAL